MAGFGIGLWHCFSHKPDTTFWGWSVHTSHTSHRNHADHDWGRFRKGSMTLDLWWSPDDWINPFPRPPGCGTEKCCVFFPTKNNYLEHLVMGNCLQSVSFAYSFLALKQMPCMLKNSHMFAGFIQISIVKRIPSLTSENSWKLSFFHVMFHHLTVQSPFVWWLNYVKFWFFRVKHHFSFAVFNRFQPSVVS